MYTSFSSFHSSYIHLLSTSLFLASLKNGKLVEEELCFPSIYIFAKGCKIQKRFKGWALFPTALGNYSHAREIKTPSRNNHPQVLKFSSVKSYLYQVLQETSRRNSYGTIITSRALRKQYGPRTVPMASFLAYWDMLLAFYCDVKMMPGPQPPPILDDL